MTSSCCAGTEADVTQIPHDEASAPGVETEVTTGYLMMPDQANHLGNIHGGYVLKLIDQTAALCACRYTRSECVTASVDRVDFKSPIAVHNFVKMHAKLHFTGRTSMEIEVQVTAEDLLSGRVTHTNTCHVTMVAVDEHMKPHPVPPWTPVTERDRALHAEAAERRQLRLEAKGRDRTH